MRSRLCLVTPQDMEPDRLVPLVAAALAGGDVASLIVGAGGARTRHDAMALGEANPDYLFFGRLDGDNGEAIFRKALELAAWWSSVFVIPAMVMGGRDLASVEAAAREGIEFVALCHAVFDDPRGPAAAVAEANERLARIAEAAA